MPSRLRSARMLIGWLDQELVLPIDKRRDKPSKPTDDVRPENPESIADN